MIYFLSIFHLAFASFDLQFEYQSVQPQQAEIPLYFEQFDSEYSSHILNYSLPLEKHIHFLRNSKIFQLQQGSISSNEFLKHSQLKIQQRLIQNLGFKLLYFEQKDFENTQQHGIFEFSYQIERWLLSAYVDLEFKKREDNAGTSISYALSDNHWLKLFVGFPLYDWNNRNREADEITRQPYSLGFVGRLLKDNEEDLYFLEYGLRAFTPTEWKRADHYWESQKQTLILRYHYLLKDHYSFEVSHQSDISKQNFLHLNHTTVEDRFHLYRNQTFFKYHDLHWTENWNYETGVYVANRRIRDVNSFSFVDDYLPFLTFHDLRPRLWGYLSYGYDFTWHATKGPRSKDGTENRLNIYWKAPFENASLQLILTFDLDDLNSRPWEGGHGSFEMLF